MPEILIILAIALIVIGPKKLPDLAKTLGRAMGEFKRSAQDFKRSIDVETTVKDIKDIADPKIDLEDIIKDANTPDKTPDPSVPDSDATDPENHTGADPKINPSSTGEQTDPEPDKTDTPSHTAKGE